MYSVCTSTDYINTIYWTHSYEQALNFIQSYSWSSQSKVILMKNCSVYQVFNNGVFQYGHKYLDSVVDISNCFNLLTI